MASLFNSKHNKYFSTPDWFKDTTFDEPIEKPSSIIYASGGGDSTGLLNIQIYNKFVLEQAELDNEALINTNIALNTNNSIGLKIGSNVNEEGWGTTGFIRIASGSTMTVTSKIDILSDKYGIIFYDHSLNAINVHYLTMGVESVVVPDNAFHFRISTPLGYDEFGIVYFKPVSYTDDLKHTSDLNTSDFLKLNEEIPEGVNKTIFKDRNLKLLAQAPLLLVKDNSNIIKLSIDASGDQDDMLTWDKKLAAFGYDKDTDTAYCYIDDKLLYVLDEYGNAVPETTNNPDFWKYDKKQLDKWIIKTTKPRFSIMDGLIEYDDKNDTFLFHKNIVTSGSVTMYANLNDVKLPNLYDGLPIDNSTILWKSDEDNNKVLTADFSKLDDYAHKKKDEQIEGVYNFKNGVRINDNHLYYDTNKNAWMFNGNLVVTGGVTMYQTGGIQPEYNLLDYITVYPPLYKEDGMLKLNTSGLGGGNGEGSGLFGIQNGNVTNKMFLNGLSLSEDGKIIIAYKKELDYTDLPDLSQHYVNRSTDQTVEGWKNFITGLKINNVKLYHLQDNTVFLDGNLVLRGGVTIYGDVNSDIPSILDAIPPAGYNEKGLAAFDSNDFNVDNGIVSLKSKGGTSNGIEYPLTINVNNTTYTYDGSANTSIRIDYTTLGLDNRYIRSDNITSLLRSNDFRQIKEVDESGVTDDEILYIITS